MMRILCSLSVAGVLAAAPNATAKPKGDKLEALFKKLDTNGDGTLSKEEFAKISERRKNGEGKGKGKGAERLYDKLDTKGDGKLTLDEFRKITELRQQKKADK